jgi:Na+-translocating ferredoxin:NAD+ oxidoreductase RNF subunit RnfB
VKANQDEFYGLFCPIGGMDVMREAAKLLGVKIAEKAPTIAVLYCNGTCENAPDKVIFSGLSSCRLAARISVGKSGCPNGCLRFGDCVDVCTFDALHISKEGIPVVNEKKCTSCNKCVKICPRELFEIRPRGVDNKRVYVACKNKQKGAVARKNCTVACIACSRCVKVCEEITVVDNLADIPASVDAIKYGEELAKCCPTKAIIYTGLKK